MQDSEMCPKCKSTNVIKKARFADRGHGNSTDDQFIEVYENPGAMIFKGAQKHPLHAWVCGTCGFVELYVDKPEELWEFHKRHSLT